jgi:hypothetical protein
MAHPGNALQAAIYTRLTAYSALTTALGGSKIYDHVPQDTAAPYVLIGDDTLTEGDTKSANGWEATVTIHCWDYEVAGRKSVKTLMGHIFDALHRQESNITVTGFTLVYIHREFEETYQETAEDGANDHYYHGVQRFRALITETTL